MFSSFMDTLYSETEPVQSNRGDKSCVSRCTHTQNMHVSNSPHVRSTGNTGIKSKAELHQQSITVTVTHAPSNRGPAASIATVTDTHVHTHTRTFKQGSCCINRHSHSRPSCCGATVGAHTCHTRCKACVCICMCVCLRVCEHAWG